MFPPEAMKDDPRPSSSSSSAFNPESFSKVEWEDYERALHQGWSKRLMEEASAPHACKRRYDDDDVDDDNDDGSGGRGGGDDGGGLS